MLLICSIWYYISKLKSAIPHCLKIMNVLKLLYTQSMSSLINYMYLILHIYIFFQVFIPCVCKTYMFALATAVKS